MTYGVYTIYDDVAKECGPIFSSKNDAVAFRAFNSFIEQVNVPKEDYSLFCLGYMDTENVSFIPEKNNGRLVTEDFESLDSLHSVSQSDSEVKE